MEMETKYIIQSFRENGEFVGYLSNYGAGGQFTFSQQQDEAVEFDKKEDCIFSDGQTWKMGRSDENGYYKIISTTNSDIPTVINPDNEEPKKETQEYKVEITSITVGGTEVKLSKKQAENLSDKIKQYCSNDVNVNAYIMQIVDENRGQDYFGKHRPDNSSDIPNNEQESASIKESEKSELGIESPDTRLVNSIKKLNLQKPIVFFDVETTGLDIGVDRIISVSVIKVMPDGEMISKNSFVNPTIPISKEATEVHGITNEMLVEKPKFSQIAKSMYEFMNGCYMGGYNNNYFDNSMIQEEFLRCDIEFPPLDVVSVDACAIFKSYEKRDLTSALKFYCGKEMENAHDADADNRATIEVFFAQLERYEELKGKSVEEIAKVCKNDNSVDFQGRIVLDADGDYVWNFGKPKGKKIKTEMGFGDWVLTNNFPKSFKNLVSRILSEIRKK